MTSIFLKMEDDTKIRLHTKNQLPRLPGSALKVPVWVGGVGGWVVGSYPLSSQAPTPVEVELGCDNLHFKVASLYINPIFI